MFAQAMGKLGFGCMRLPMMGEEVDLEQFRQMVDCYLDAGFAYFDTAHVYIEGKSELALRDALVRRYPREKFFLVNKLSGSQFQSAEEIRPFFEMQLDACGVDYFDLYLMHSQTMDVYRKFTACHAYEEVAQLKKEGKLKHFGISFHDKPNVLEMILDEHPEIEVVQIQLNYLDIDSPSVESRAVYEICRKYGKPVLVMEPVKGGALTQLPEEADALLRTLGKGSNAEYAIRYAASFEGVAMVLSGMSTLEQMQDNTGFMKEFTPISEREYSVIMRVTEILKKQNLVPCTGCRYCVAGCPRKIHIPDIFACLNTAKRYKDWSSEYYYTVCTTDSGKASDCIECGKCEQICPQHLPIRELLKTAAAAFEKK